MKKLTMALATVLILIGNIVNLNAFDFWVKYHNMTDEIVDITTYDSYFPTYLTENNKLFIGNSTELNIPEPSPVYNSVVRYSNYIHGIKEVGFFAGTNNYGIFKYKQKSKTWEEFNTGLADTNMKVLYSEESFVFAKSSDNRLWKSDKDSCNWELMDAGLEGINVISVFFRGTYRNVMQKYNYIAGTNEKGVYGWNEELLKWEPFNNGIENETVIGTFISGQYFDFFFHEFGLFWAATKNGMFKLESVDGPELYKWVPYNQGLKDLKISSIGGLEIGTAIIDFLEDEFPVIVPMSLFISTEDGCFYYQQENKEYGTTWIMDTSGLDGNKINKINSLSIYNNQTMLFAATNSGVYKINANDVYTEKHDNSFSNSLTISPNPASETANISFELDLDANVSIYITDILSNKVADILDNKYYSSGQHSVEFNTLGLSAGIYFCTVKSGIGIETRKINILK